MVGYAGAEIISILIRNLDRILDVPSNMLDKSLAIFQGDEKSRQLSCESAELALPSWICRSIGREVEQRIGHIDQCTQNVFRPVHCHVSTLGWT